MKAGASSDGEEARAPKSALRDGPSGGRRQGTARIENGAVAEKEKNEETAARPRGLHETPESTRVVGRHVRRRGTTACSDRMKSDNVRIGAFVDLQKKSSGGVEKGEIADEEKLQEGRGRGMAQSECQRACVW